MKKTLLVTVLAGLVLSLTACAPYSNFKNAIDECNATEGTELGDDGTTLTIDMMGEEEYSGASYSDTMCLIRAVGTPDYVISDIESTNSMAGRQDAEFDGITATWDYHPDNGLDITFHKK